MPALRSNRAPFGASISLARSGSRHRIGGAAGEERDFVLGESAEEDIETEVDDVPSGDHIRVARGDALGERREQPGLGRKRCDEWRWVRLADEEDFASSALPCQRNHRHRAVRIGLDVKREPLELRHNFTRRKRRLDEHAVDAAARLLLTANAHRTREPQLRKGLIGARALERLDANSGAWPARARPRPVWPA